MWREEGDVWIPNVVNWSHCHCHLLVRSEKEKAVFSVGCKWNLMRTAAVIWVQAKMATFEKNNRSCEFPTTWNWNVETPHQTFCKYRVLIQAGNRTYWSTYPVITCVILSPTPHLHGLWRSKISRKLHDSKQWQTTRCRISRKLHDSKRWPTTRSRTSRKLHGGNDGQPPPLIAGHLFQPRSFLEIMRNLPPQKENLIWQGLAFS